MNQKKRTRQILKFLSKNPLSTTRNIADNASQTRINHNVVRTILTDLMRDNKIDQLFGHYYVIPTPKNEIQLLSKITKLNDILKPKFKRLSYQDTIKIGTFRHILELYILLIRLQLKIYKVKSLREKKSHVLDKKAIERIRKDMLRHLRSFKVSNNLGEFHNCLIKHIDDRYFSDIRQFYDLAFRSRSLKDRVKMLSAFFITNNVKEISDQFDYDSNKVPRKMVDGWFYKNKNIDLAEIYAGIAMGQITNSEASDLFRQWHAYVGLTKRNDKDGREFDEKELKQYRKNFMKEYKKLYKTDINKIVHIRSYGIS